MTFESMKKEILKKKDKSRAKKIDPQIKYLVDAINAHKDYFTTSSCAGRIMVYEPSEDGKKFKTKWYFVSHEPVEFDELMAKLKKLPSNYLWFKMESPILHISCRTIELANKLLRFAINCGLKHSGIISMERKNIVSIVDSNVVSAIIAKDNRFIVSEDYIKELIKLGNEKIAISRKRFDKIMKFFI